jgi:phosphodiesterase/alkaline phosphatase D-like protein
MRLSRRQALLAASVAALSGCDETAPRGAAVPFAHGVASGDPLQDRVILWTRITPPPGSDGVDVAWTLARDLGLSDVVARGEARAELGRDWTVKVDAGGLSPGTTYYYGFEALGARSPVGRTATLPQGRVERFALAVVCCANHPAGWFNVYRDIVRRDEAQLVVHLGDYYYEYGAGGPLTAWGKDVGRIPSPRHDLVTLTDYRMRHAQYKSDPDLQVLHAALPWIVIWDDHESANDSSSVGAQNHDPAREGPWSARKAASVQAYLEWMPIREPTPGRAREAIWRSFEIGDLATLVMLETRLLARSRGLTWQDAPFPADSDPSDPAVRAARDAFLRDVVGDPKRELLGSAQLADVAATLARSTAAGKPWQILGNQVIMAKTTAPDYMAALPAWVKWLVREARPWSYDQLLRSRLGVPLNFDQWDGYPAERERLYKAAAGAQLLTLSGDSHCFYVNRLTRADGGVAGVEVGAPGVTSPCDWSRLPTVDVGRLVEAASPDVLHHNPYDRGYVAIDLTRDEATAELRRVDTVESRRFRVETYATWRIARNGEGVLEATRA